MLDAAFKFSQHSLSDFADCPRRFYLRYIARQPWPAVDTRPLGLGPLDYQDYLWRGTVLHRRIERYWLGISTASSQPPVVSSQTAASVVRRSSSVSRPPSLGHTSCQGEMAVPSSDEELAVWWTRFTGTDFSMLPAERVPELALTAQIGKYLLYARFDLLAVDPSGGCAVIVDWKTLRGETAPRASFFAQRWQTRVYLYVLATAGAACNGGAPLGPEQCSMHYWLANFPEQPWVRLPYSRAEYEQESRRLLAAIESIACREREADFGMSGDQRKCAYCNYRTLCDRRMSDTSAESPSAAWPDVETLTELEY